MKRGYKRLLIFEIIIFIILILNSFVSNILIDYKIVIFLIIILAIFKVLFGFEKDRHRYTKDIIFDIVIFLLTFFILFYISGLIISFAKTGNYYDIKSIIEVILPIILIIILKEFLRYQILNKSEENKILIILTTILFIFFDITSILKSNLNQSSYGIFVFLAITVLPSISMNIVCSYISIKTGYKPMILFRLVMELYLYLIPIVPNPNAYILSIIKLLLPVIFCYKMYVFFQKEHDEFKERIYKKRKLSSLIVPTIIVVIIVYFTSGYFKYYALAIASGSMSPMIKKGDVVIVNKRNDYENFKVGEVLAYKYENIVIVHRIVKKIHADNVWYFYTKGDANNDIDNYPIKEEMVIGTANIKIPYIGLPTVWLNNL